MSPKRNRNKDTSTRKEPSIQPPLFSDWNLRLNLFSVVVSFLATIAAIFSFYQARRSADSAASALELQQAQARPYVGVSGINSVVDRANLGQRLNIYLKLKNA